MNSNRVNCQKGIAQLAVIAVMAFLALGLPAATKLVQQNQENRSKATDNYISEGNETTPSPTRVPTRPPITRVPTQTPPPIPNGTSKVSIFHNFAPKDYSIRKIGSVLVNDIVIKTEGRKINSATVVYCYTDLLKPDFNSISGEQIASVISNKEIGNNCAEVKVSFNDKELNDSFPPYENLKGYIISYKVSVVKYGRGMVKIDCSNTSLIDKNGEEVSVEDFYCEENGTDFTLTDPQNISPTPTPSPISKPTRKPTYPPITPSARPVTKIKISPENLKLKVGQSQNLAYTLNPISSSDTVKWSTSGSGQVRIQKITPKCANSTTGLPTDDLCLNSPDGSNHLQITGLKAGTVKIKLTTSSNQSAEATITVTNNSTTKPTPTPTKKPTPTPTPSNKVNKIGKYIDLIFDPDDIVKISDENLNLWSSRLNLAYTDYVELTGYKPYNGGKITIKSVSCGDNCPGWAWSGQTISWAKKWWLVDEFEKINNNDDWSFGILHEISHDFDFNDFGNRRGHNFDSELMANFKMVYLIEKRNAKVSPGYSGNYYVGPQIINYYKTADKGYEYAIKNNAFTGDFLTYILLREKDRFGGWDTYKKVFRNLGYKSVTSESASFKAFLNEITLISKKDSKGMFNQQEKDIIIKQYGNIFPQTSTNSKPTAIDGVCGSIKYSELTLTSDKDKPEILCKSGKVVGFERSGANVTDRVPLYYSWDCLGLNGGDTVGCGVNPPATPQKVINGVCGTVKYSQLSKNSPSDKSITLCKSGKLGEFFTMYEKPSSTELTYVWDCLGSNGGRNIQCNVSNTAQKIDGACGSLKYSDITPDINKTNPTLLCKSGKLINFVGVTPNCITGPNCPPANYSWSCIGTNGGKSVKCTKYGNPVINPPIPATKVRVTPIFTRLKVGQNRILTYTLTPSSSTDIVKWVTFGNGLVEIEKTATNQLKITALKAGSIRIKITTSSGKSAQSIIFINK